MFKKANPGCPCCCPQCEDGWAWFAGNISNFSGDTTSWSSSGTCEAATTEGSSTLLHKTAYPFNSDKTRSAGDHGTVNPYHQHSVRANFTATASGTKFRLIVVASDASNFLAVEIEIGDDAGMLRLIKCVAGVVTALTDDHVIPAIVPNASLWVAGDFDDGEFRGRIGETETGSGHGTYDNYGAYGGIVDCDVWTATTGAEWVRWTRADNQSYVGTSVGLAVVNNTGTVTLHQWDAGCSAVFEFCDFEHDYYEFRPASWASAHWSMLSGNAPVRGVFPVTWPYASDGTTAIQTTGGGSGDGTGDVNMLHLNPVPAVYRNCYTARAFFYIDYATAAGGDWAIGTYIGCDRAGTNGYYLKQEYTFNFEQVGVRLHCYINEILYRMDGTVLDSWYVGTGGPMWDASVSRYRGICGPVGLYSVGGHIGSGIFISAAGQDYGGYSGLILEPPGNNGVLLTQNFRVQRCSYAADDNDYSEPSGCEHLTPYVP